MKLGNHILTAPVQFLCLLAIWPGTKCNLQAAEQTAPPLFRFVPSEKSLALWEGNLPVYVYNHGVIERTGVPADRARSTYLHPVYGLDGEVLTDDFPEDHHHHRGVFWAWPHVRIGNQHYDLWMLKGIEQRFESWLQRDASDPGATLGVANAWLVENRKVMQEQVWIRSSPTQGDHRFVDIELIWTALDNAVTLQGAEGKSYGGLTFRFAPHQQTVITTAQGQGKEDLTIARLPWADLSGRFAGRTQTSGAAILISPDHPGYPPEWLTRHYGVLCVGWPGVKPKTIAPGETIRCRYRIWIHRGTPDPAQLAAVYRDYR